MPVWAQVSKIAFFGALGAYLAAMLAYFHYLAFRRAGSWRVADLLSWVGLAANTGSVVARGVAAGHVPWGTMYEYSTLLALLVVVMMKVVERRYGVKTIGGFALAFSVITMAIANIFLYRGPGPLVPALDAVWLKVHVVSIIIASALLSLGAGVLTPLYLVAFLRERRAATQSQSLPVREPVLVGGEGKLPDREARDEDESLPSYAPAPDEPLPAANGARRGILPPSDTLDRLAYRTIAFGFLVWTFGVIAGAVWAQRAWGRYWGWDPKEVWSFITWVIFAAYLHARATVGWKGVKAGMVALVGFGSLLFTYYAVNTVIVGLHSYAGI